MDPVEKEHAERKRVEREPLDEAVYRDTTGTLLMKLKQQGCRDVKKASQAIDALRQRQRSAGVYSFDNFTVGGSDALSGMACELDGEQRECIVWSINHYLNLNRHEYVIEKSIAATRAFGCGCGTSAISGGMNTLHKEIEARLRHWYRREIMLFPTGFTANMGCLSALCQADDHVLIDSESHASIRDGIRLSPARRWISFEHNCLRDLEEKLKLSQQTCRGNLIVVVESAYSMSGDICPLDQVVALKERYDFVLFVDEAHSFGLYGEQGRGLCDHFGVLDQVDFLTSTFSKATASLGGFVASRREYVSYFQWSANAFAFQACFTPGDAGTILAALDVIESDPELVCRLHAKNQYMRAALREAGFNLGASESPIIPIYIPDTQKLLRVSFELYREGIFSVPIAYPMVRHDEGRIRFIVNAAHRLEHIDKTVSTLRRLAEKYHVLDDQKAVRC